LYFGVRKGKGLMMCTVLFTLDLTHFSPSGVRNLVSTINFEKYICIQSQIGLMSTLQQKMLMFSGMK
jgi:hypothetical protein